MKRIRETHLAIVVFLIGIVLTIWLARMPLIQADVESLKPGSVSHTQNILEPTTGEVGSSSAVDFDKGGDASTYSVMYLQDEGADSRVLFSSFDDPAEGEDAFMLGVIYSFEKKQGDDGISIEYSTSGAPGCLDHATRTWVTLARAEATTPRMRVEAELTGVAANQVCVKFDRILNGESDASGHLFRDSNFMRIYDVWMDTAEARVEAAVSTESVQYAVGEHVMYRIEARNTGTGTADSVTVRFPMPKGMQFVSARSENGLYDVRSGRWAIGTIMTGKTATLELIAKLDEGFAGERVQASAGVSYVDRLSGDEKGHANSLYFIISNTPSGVILDESVVVSPMQEEEVDETSTPQLEDVPVGPPINPQDIAEVSANVCDFECREAGFYLYIVNPNGSIRETLSNFARVTPLSDRRFLISFEDSGSDFDYNDIVFDLDVSDCQNIAVTLKEMNAGWRHEVRASIRYKGVVEQDILLWPNSHEAIGDKLHFDLGDYLNECRG